MEEIPGRRILRDKREYHKTQEKKSQRDIGPKSFGVIVKQYTEAQHNGDQKIDDTDKQRLLPVGFYRIKKVADAKRVPIPGEISCHIGYSCLRQAMGEQQYADDAIDKADGDKHPEILKPYFKETKKWCFLFRGVRCHYVFLLYLIMFLSAWRGWMFR